MCWENSGLHRRRFRRFETRHFVPHDAHLVARHAAAIRRTVASDSTKCSRKCRYSEPERLNFFRRSTYNSQVFNAGQGGPLHRRQVRAAVNLPEKPLKIKALVGAGRFERPTPCAQDIGTFILTWSANGTLITSSPVNFYMPECPM